MWAKISTSATAMACAACIATAATLPVMGPAEEQLAKTASVKLSALSAAFDAWPLYEAFLANPSEETLGALLAVVGASTLGAVPLYAAFLADPTATTLGALLDGVDATSATSLYTDFLADPSETTLGALLAVVGASTLGAVPLYAAFLADPNETTVRALLDGVDATSAVTSYVDAIGDPSQLANIDAVSAAPNYINSLGGDLSRASGLSGIDAFSGLPAYNAVLNGDISALAPSPNPNPDGAPIGGIAAFSAVPGYLGTDPPEVAPDIPYEAPIMAQARVAPESESSSTTPTIGSSPLTSVAPAVDEEEVTPTPTDNSGADSQNIVRDSKKFTRGSTGNSPILFGSGTPGGEGMRGYGSFLKKLGLGGEQSPGGATPGMAPATG